MRLFHVTVWGSLIAVSVTAAAAQSREEFMRCRMIEQDAARLACYDAMNLSAASPRSKYEPTPLEELQNYALTYRGRFVEVAGWIDPGDRFFFLSAGEGEAESLPVDFESLSRADQQTFRERCGEGCRAIVQGRVGPVNFTTGIVAEALVPQ